MLTYDDYKTAAKDVFHICAFSHTDSEEVAQDLIECAFGKYLDQTMFEFGLAVAGLSRSMDIRNNGLLFFIHYVCESREDIKEADMLYRIVASSVGHGIGIQDYHPRVVVEYWLKKLGYAQWECWNDDLFSELIISIADEENIELNQSEITE